MDLYEYDKYVIDIDNCKKTLNKYGVAIIPNVLTETECKKMVSGVWKFFEDITKNTNNEIKKKDKNTWRNMFNLFPMHSMLIQHWGVGHNQTSWDVRQNKKIVSVFSKLWDCKKTDLLVSFDGLSFGLPHEVTKRGYYRDNNWYHTDQSFTRPDFECIQSWVTGLDVNAGDATLTFMEKSHKYHNEFREKFNVTNKADWYKLKPEEEQFYIDKKCKYKKIMCPKGSLVLWDSRTIHAGCEALKDRPTPNMRCVIYLCYQPKDKCDKKNIEKKKKAFNELRTTSHYPCKIKLFSKNPRTYGKDLPEINSLEPPKLNKLGLSLAGF